jgi:hypothetical protein
MGRDRHREPCRGGGDADDAYDDALTGGGGAAGFTTPGVFEATVTGGGAASGTFDATITGGGIASDIYDPTVWGGAGVTVDDFTETDYGALIGGGPAGGTGIRYSVDDDQLTVRGVVRAEQLYAYDLPTSSSGLASGRIWNDGGTLKVVA